MDTPVAMSTAASRDVDRPPTLRNCPPRYRRFPSGDTARDSTGPSGWASQSRRAPVATSMAARYFRGTIVVGSCLALLVEAPGGITPVNSPAMKTRLPASTTAVTFPARSEPSSAGSSDGLVPQVGFGSEAKEPGTGSAAVTGAGRAQVSPASAAAKKLAFLTAVYPR
jgi:hypothetical protein